MLLHLFLLYLGLPFIRTIQARAEEPSISGVSKISAAKSIWLKNPLPFSSDIKKKHFPDRGFECLEWPITMKDAERSLSAAYNEVKASKSWFGGSKKGNFVSMPLLQPTQQQKFYMYPMFELDIDSKGNIGPAPYMIISENGRKYAIYMVTGGNKRKIPKNPNLRYRLCFSSNN
ncbi:BgTH12-07152 [Blumeria graminis f. sp. triticale]|uniref:BgtE-10024 n=3 Tax=Blumeria graminis TaxID=34373 RepID=A0A381L8U9_BLUGR|nr:putative secreted effector protein [Blumeria graminis f. sp. tritici 96224]CAD6506225.1 BgTH12-07152 [Blumeria graminis f. sp. triticale]VDB94975.1 BgtE-10024 [Blumeria graminis f. sp. tritici]